MSRKYCFILVILFFIFGRIVHADFEITEIMYDLDGTDTDREWIEVKNTGLEPADLSKWYLFSDNSKHTLMPQGDSNVQSGGYAVIAQNISKFKVDWPNYSGSFFDSSWTGFNNETESIALKDPDLNIISPFTYNSSMGGSGDGNSLQYINGAWQGAVPTPGVENQTTNNTDNNQNLNTTSNSNPSGVITSSSSISSSSSSVSATKKESDNPKITTKIITKNIAVANVPFEIDHTTIGLKKEKIIFGRFVWNFGDGMKKEGRTSDPFQYIYQYPGDYVVTLSYYNTFFDAKPEAVDRMIMKVIPSGINISSVGNINDPYIELENNSNYEISLMGWKVIGVAHHFIIPDGMVLLPNKKLKLSPRITGFDINDLNNIKIINETGEIFVTYPNIKPPLVGTSSIKSFNQVISESVSLKKDESIKKSEVTSETINLNDLGASSASSDISKNIGINTYAWFGLFGIIIVGIVSVFMIQKKREDDYPEYIEGKQLSAKDMTIIE